MTTSTETKIALLEQERKQMATDISDLKDDVKQIKDFLMGEEPKIVTKKEFDAYAAQTERRRFVQNTLSAILGVVMTILVGYFITNVGK